MNRARKDEEEEEEEGEGSAFQRGIVVRRVNATAGRPREFGPMCVCVHVCAHCCGQTDRLVPKSS